jgi:hypothetical protein
MPLKIPEVRERLALAQAKVYELRFMVRVRGEPAANRR